MVRRAITQGQARPPSRGRLGLRRHECATRGFTLIEMVIVISIVLILVAVAVPMYQQSMLRAREAVLRDNLFTMRSVIDQFTLDKQRAPQSLQEVVSEGYLRQIPVDPFTGSRDTWIEEMEDYMLSVDQNQPGITNVRSGSDQIGTDGTPYSTW
jgi:general secretion pathway protein G